jgi:hypothetical protein
LWDEFKQRLGTSEFKGFTIQPSDLISQDNQLQHLEEPFTIGEIDNIIKSLSSNKSPGSDDFNNEFTKATWPI